MKTENILGYNVSSEGCKGDVERAWQYIMSGAKGKYMSCINPHSLVVSRTDKLFKEALDESDILLPDGSGIILAAKILGKPIHERVAGLDFFTGLSSVANNEKKIKYFFLGSTDNVLEKISKRIADEYQNIEVCGVLSPPFKTEFTVADNDLMIQIINDAKPDVLWVGMTAPKQEKWIYQNRDKLDVPLMGAIGAVFDFYAGTIKRSPEWACKMGLEWLPRLLREPKRLFRRNFISSPVFLLMVFKNKFGLGKG